MARITIEKCNDFNRFELVLLAAQRAHDIARGAPLTVDRDNDKNSVIALREIEENTVSVEELKEHLIRGFMTHHDQDEEEHSELESLSEESGWLHGDGGGNMKEEIIEDELTVTDDLETSEAADVSETAI